MILVSGGILIYSLIIHDKALTVLGIGLTAITMAMVVLQWIVSARTSCPLCMTPVLGQKRCMKHRHARTFMGSHRLRVALAILIKKSFRCPYCNEPTAMEVRNRTQYVPYSRG